MPSFFLVLMLPPRLPPIDLLATYGELLWKASATLSSQAGSPVKSTIPKWEKRN